MGYFVLFFSLFVVLMFYCAIWNLRIGNMSHRKRGRRISATHRHREKRKETFAEYLAKSKSDKKRDEMNLITIKTTAGAHVSINPLFVTNCYQRYGTGCVVLILSTGSHYVLGEDETFRSVITRIRKANDKLPF